MTKSTVRSMFEITEMTELGKQVYQIVEDGNPQGKYVIVDVDEWEKFEAWRVAQRSCTDEVHVGPFLATPDNKTQCSACGEVLADDRTPTILK
jgi:hypothetical protein